MLKLQHTSLSHCSLSRSDWLPLLLLLAALHMNVVIPLHEHIEIYLNQMNGVR